MMDKIGKHLKYFMFSKLQTITCEPWYNDKTLSFFDKIQLMHSFEVNIRICQPEKVISTEAKKNASIVLLYETVSLSLIYHIKQFLILPILLKVKVYY